MSIFRNKSARTKSAAAQSAMAELALKTIHDGVIITNKDGIVEYANPAAAIMTGYGSPDKAIGLDYGLIVKLESKEGRELLEGENLLAHAMSMGEPLESFAASLIVNQSDKRIPVAISVIPAGGLSPDRIIVFRNITKELQEEGEQAEFISTASHEMRTPVATIDGYLSLCLNPQTAAIDDRARGYLAAAQAASKHLGKLFQDLLDATKLDDGHIKPRLEPVEVIQLAKSIVKDHLPRAEEAKIKLSFGSDRNSPFGDGHHLEQVVYSFVDVNFFREILDNLIDNALKYTPDGGSVYVNVRGDGDRVLINVTDNGIGISTEDLAHIFQKFYRADNSDTRTIGGTGLGLYLVKQRATAMGGKVWAESAFGEGSTFYVSLPRLSSDEYEKRMIMVRNRQIQEQLMPIAPAQPNPFIQPNPSMQPNPFAPPAMTPAPSTAPTMTPAPSVAPVTVTTASSVTPAMPPTAPPTMAPAMPPAVSPPAPVAPPAAPTAPATMTPPAAIPVAQPTTPSFQQNTINPKGESK